MTKSIPLKKIRIDGGTQAREHLNMDAVEDYAQAYRDGARMPAIALIFDGADYWLADGFHRYHGATKAGLTKIDAEVANGTQRAAILYAISANQEHGLRRTNADKRRAVEMLLRDEEWRTWSDGKLASMAGVSDKTVASVRSSIPGISGDGAVRKVERNGSIYEMDTSSLGPRPATSTEETGPTSTPATSAPVPAPAPAPAPVAASATPAAPPPLEDGSDFDPLEELEAANLELTKLRQIVEADDKAAEIERWRSAYEVAQRRCDEHLGTVAARDKQIGFLSRQLQRCGKAVGEADTDKIAPAVERLARAAKVTA